MTEELNRCKQGEKFCPVSFKKHSLLFWILLMTGAISSLSLNVIIDSPSLLCLYAFPAVLLAVVRISIRTFVFLGASLLASVFLIRSPDFELVAAVAAFAALMLIVKRVVWISARHYISKNEQEDSIMNTVFMLAKTIDTRDPYTAYHSVNVASYARSIAGELGMTQKEMDAVYLAGLIHDIGKIGTPDAILRKESRLTEEEYAIMKKHSEDGYQIIKDMKRLRELGIADMVRYHHERPDGKGYPHGLKGVDIPIGARILGVADAFDAMTTNRAYRTKLAIETAVEELRRHGGTQFDRVIAEALLHVLKREGKLVLEEASVGSQLSLA